MISAWPAKATYAGEGPPASDTSSGSVAVDCCWEGRAADGFEVVGAVAENARNLVRPSPLRFPDASRFRV